MIRFQQSAEMLNPDALTLTALTLRLDDQIETLANSLVMAVLEILGQHIA